VSTSEVLGTPVQGILLSKGRQISVAQFSGPVQRASMWTESVPDSTAAGGFTR
jgi:hypothetical protein